MTSTAQVDGTVSSQIINGNNQTLQAVCSVPVGKIGLICGWWGSLSGRTTADVDFILRVGRLGGLGYVQQERSTKTAFDFTFDFPLMVGPALDIWIEVTTDTNNTGVAGGFTVLYKDDDLSRFPTN